jgi:hypothetical protein
VATFPKALREWAEQAMSTDPRRAIRAALVTTGLFALAHYTVAQAQVVTFVAFGAFTFLALIDLGGSARARALAYSVIALVCSVLIALGTAVSLQPWSAALTMLAVAFGVQFAGVLGGYVTGAQPALLLAYVLAATVPAPPEAIPVRLAGWLPATAGHTLAYMFGQSDMVTTVLRQSVGRVGRRRRYGAPTPSSRTGQVAPPDAIAPWHNWPRSWTES